MRVTVRAKLILIAGTASLALCAFIASSAWTSAERDKTMADVERRLLPRLELGPRIASTFEDLRRGMQDAAAAEDREALDKLEATRDKLISLLDMNHEILDVTHALEAEAAVAAYYESSRSIARRLIAGETGVVLVDDMREMQARLADATTAVKHVTSLQTSELDAALALVEESNDRAGRFQISVGAAALMLLLILSIWFGGTLLRALSATSSGLARFATGDFGRRIVVSTDDEIGDLAREANAMAESLDKLSRHRARGTRLQKARVGLAETLRDVLDPTDVAERALTFLARQVDASSGAFFVKGEDGRLHALAGYARTGDSGELDACALGDGLVGQAALSDAPLDIHPVPPSYPHVRSGTGEAPAACLVFLPLSRGLTRFGVVEFAFLRRPEDDELELLSACRGALVAAVDVTASRAALGKLLTESTELAERLAAQEEELRANNENLHSQQEELRQANERLQTQGKALTNKNADLEAAKASLQAKASELARVSDYKSQFLAKMSHELRTPLNSMLLLSQLLAGNDTGTLTPKQVEYASTIRSAGTDLLTLINQLLDLAKIEAGKQEVLLEQVTVEHFLEQVQRIFGPVAREKGVTLRTEAAPDLLGTLTTDVARVERILANLVGNALKFTRTGSVEVSVRPAPPDTVFLRAELQGAKMVAFEVRDTGVGIPKAALERLFLPFEQVESSAREVGGTGLGLAIARESALLLGGELHVDSAEGRGSKFTCYLPQRSTATPALPRNNRARKARTSDDRDAMSESDHCLLIVEDDPVLAEQLVELTRQRRFKAIVADTGQEALRLAKECLPQGIVLDVRLPDTDGFAVMDRLRRDPTTAHIPVHFLSAVDSPVRGMALGAIGYLVKPATREELVSMVRALTVSSRDGVSRVLVVEDDAREGASILEVLGKDGVAAEYVASATAALGALRSGDFGCMILDLGLPDMDGVELLHGIASDADLALPRVIVHTGRALTRQETRRIETYAEAVVLKDGASVDRLLEEVRLFLHHVAPSGANEKTATAPSGSAHLNGATLLLADDDMRTVYALSALLRAGGAEVLVADNGREAVDLLNQHDDVDAVLMDVMMPEMDGYEAMRKIRSDARFESLPIIALTARAMKGERERCLKAGASDYLSKPVNGDELLSALEQWLFA